MNLRNYLFWHRIVAMHSAGAVALALLAAEVRIEAASGLTVAWTNNLLSVSGPSLPGKRLDILYLEAFCQSNSTHQSWGKTTIPHKTALLSASPTQLTFRTAVSTNVEMLHEVKASQDELEFTFAFKNFGPTPVDLEWFQPACIRVERFTGLKQSNYITRAFIFTDQGLTPLAQTRRREEAIYRGGQVYVPSGINLSNVNPRPISDTRPVNGLVGCFSEDNRFLLATASDHTHELFEGVFVCLHSDPHVGGLKPGESKSVRSKLYLLTNDVPALLARYQKDFPKAGAFQR
jgi:hypothetical protein